MKYSFGIVPQQSRNKLVDCWKPFLDYISEKSNVPLQIKSAWSIPRFEDVLAEGGYDFAYMNPYHYTVFHEKAGYDAIAKAKNSDIRGILVVRKDSPINSIYDLSGEKLAFPSPGAFAASILVRDYLKKNHIPFIPVYVNSHSSVYLSVLQRRYVAGGGIPRTLQAFPDKSDLRILWMSDPYSSHAIAVHPRVPKEVVAKVLQAMCRMDRDDAGKSILEELHIPGIEKAEDADWNDIRSLKIEQPLGSQACRP